jgi:hypothetical protein
MLERTQLSHQREQSLFPTPLAGGDACALGRSTLDERREIVKIGIRLVLAAAVVAAIGGGAARAATLPEGRQNAVAEALGAAAGGGLALPAVFRGDARLEAKVTVAEKNRPLGEVLTGIGAQIGVRLAASSETADDKVTLFLDGRSAAEALALVARQFGFQWQRSHDGYELAQDLAAREREAALRESGRAAQIAAIQARMGRVASIVSSPRASSEARWNEIERRLSDPSVTPEERASLAEEQAAFQDAERPGAAAAVAIYRALTPAQLALLRAGGEIRLSTTDGSLAPPLAETVR